MKRTITNFLSCSALIALTYFGLFQGIKGAENLLKAYVLIALAIISLGLHSEAIKRLAELLPKQDWLRWFYRLTSWGMFLSLIWTGNFFTAMGWGLCMFMTQIVNNKVKEFRAQK